MKHIVKQGEPQYPGCEDRFVFTGDGAIKAADSQDYAAFETIDRLGLDIQKLNAMRAKAMEPFLDENISAEEIQTFVAGYLTRDFSGRFGEFWTTIRYLFGRGAAA